MDRSALVQRQKDRPLPEDLQAEQARLAEQVQLREQTDHRPQGAQVLESVQEPDQREGRTDRPRPARVLARVLVLALVRLAERMDRPRPAALAQLVELVQPEARVPQEALAPVRREARMDRPPDLPGARPAARVQRAEQARARVQPGALVPQEALVRRAEQARAQVQPEALVPQEVQVRRAEQVRARVQPGVLVPQAVPALGQAPQGVLVQQVAMDPSPASEAPASFRSWASADGACHLPQRLSKRARRNR